MMIYATQTTIEAYDLKLSDNAGEETGGLSDWGVKVMYFEKRPFVQLANFASKLTLFFADVTAERLACIGEEIARELKTLYRENESVQTPLEAYLAENAETVFARLKSRSMISTLNHTQTDFASDGYRFYDFMERGVLQTDRLNACVNRSWFFRYKSGDAFDYAYSADVFEKLLKERYAE